MSQNLLFEGVLIDLNSVYNLLTKSNLIQNIKVKKYYYKKLNNLPIYKSEELTKSTISKINEIDLFFKPLNLSNSFIFSLILLENKQTLKNLFRFILMKWNLKKNLLSSKYNLINFQFNLNDIENSNFDFKCLLKQLKLFVKQEQTINLKSSNHKLRIFIANCLIGYYTNII